VIAPTLDAAASCVLGPAIAAISLGLVGPLAIGERLGRNARFASLGNGVAAAVMGTAGYLLSSRSVFLVTFLLVIPTLIALSRIREHEVDIARCHGEMPREAEDRGDTNIWHLIRQRPLIVFALSVLLLQLANAAMMPLIVADVAFGSGHFNLAQGIVGTATGIGASLSTALGGYISDKFGNATAFIGLSGVAATGLLLILFVMPETRRTGMIAAKE